MNRRTLIAGTMTAMAIGCIRPGALLAQSTPSASADALPELLIVLNDEGFDVPQPLQAARYRVIVRNDGTQLAHSAFGRLPDGAKLEDLDKMGEDVTKPVNGHAFTDIGFVGLPDWPAPDGGVATGVIDLVSGDYVIFDPIGPRAPLGLTVDGDFATLPEPPSDLTVELTEMSISFPSLDLPAGKQTWKIENKGALLHDVAVMPVADTLTEDALMEIFMMPEDATPAPGAPTLDYDPKAAIGLLQPQGTSWVNVDLSPGRYLAICMIPIPGPMPHGMEGMLAFLELS